MELRSVGKSGLLVSEIGVGCNNFGTVLDRAGACAVVHAALDQGITLFDTADMYGDGASEEMLGDVLHGKRDDVIIASKFGWWQNTGGRAGGGSRRWLRQAVEASLRRLNTDHIDLYQFHRPDALTPWEETVRAMEDLVREGKVLYLGLSNVAPWQAVEAQWISQTSGGVGFASCQNELSLVIRNAESELIPMLEAKGMGLLPFYPLSAGLLTGKYRRDDTPDAGTRLSNPKGAFHPRHVSEAAWDVVERLREWCAKHDWAMSDLAFAWLLSKPQVSSVIAGASSAEQIAQNSASASRGLSSEELASLSATLENAQ
jgi:aryl-alcohol dehydrogenase-like predicted oxidoreductase